MNGDARNCGISVVIPTHGARSSLRKTVESVLAQPTENMEVIVVSDGAGQDTHRILQGIVDPRLVIFEKSAGGASATRNFGLSKARNSWIAFVDDDDVPRPEWFSTFAPHLTDSVSTVTAAVSLWRNDMHFTTKPCPLEIGEQSMRASRLMAGSFVVRRDLLVAIGGYDEQVRAAENQDLGLRLCDLIEASLGASSIINLPTVVIDVYAQEAQSRQRRYGSSFADSAKVFLDRYAGRLTNDPKEHAALLRIISRDDRHSGNFAGALGNAWVAVRLEPRNIMNARSLVASVFSFASLAHTQLAKFGALQKKRLKSSTRPA